jgi:hypothetical protein
MFVLPGLPNVGVDYTSRTIKTSETPLFLMDVGGLLFCYVTRDGSGSLHSGSWILVFCSWLLFLYTTPVFQPGFFQQISDPAA